MDKKQSLALFEKGRKAWNAWADKMLAERQALEAAGGSKWDDARKAWDAAARADFSNHRFNENVDFNSFIFPGDAVFGGATFSGDAGFTGAKFSGNAGFYGATFSGNVSFVAATFSGYAGFGEATFSGNAEFRGATFSSTAWFGEATFSGDASFISATFSETAWFYGATFSGYTSFGGAMFSDEAWFGEATFSGYAEFQQVAFEDFTNFDGARFEDAADFGAIEGKSAFSLARTTFLAVPDFIQAHFAEAPRLDDIRVEPRRSRPSTLAGAKKHFKGDPDLSARWRALKRLAIQGHDHVREQAFFKGELKARRWSEDKPWNAVFWFGFLYQWLSDFGRSLLRPLFWWTASVLGFTGLYLGEHLALIKKPMLGFDWAMSLVCVKGPGNPWWASLELSMRKALLFIGSDSTENLKQIYACLYGIYADPTVTVAPGKLPASFSPVIPDGIAFPGLVQSLLSAVLIFLFLLAVRNHFRIK